MDQFARILDVSPHATDEEIHRAYRKLASTHHPDLGGDKEEFQKIQNAYEQLLSPEGKAAREDRHYGAAAVARKRNDELRKEDKGRPLRRPPPTKRPKVRATMKSMLVASGHPITINALLPIVLRPASSTTERQVS